MIKIVHNMTVRIPLDVMNWLELEVEKNSSSHNSEIMRCIRERMQHAVEPASNLTK